MLIILWFIEQTMSLKKTGLDGEHHSNYSVDTVVSSEDETVQIDRNNKPASEKPSRKKASEKNEEKQNSCRSSETTNSNERVSNVASVAEGWWRHRRSFTQVDIEEFRARRKFKEMTRKKQREENEVLQDSGKNNNQVKKKNDKEDDEKIHRFWWDSDYDEEE